MKKLLLILFSLLLLSSLAYAGNVIIMFAAPTGGGGTTYTDDFNRADGSPGSNWTSITNETYSPVISSNQLIPSAGHTTRQGIFYNAAAAPNDQYSQITVVANATNNDGPAVRVSDSAETFYCLVGTVGTPGSLIFRKVVAGSLSQIGSTISTNFANGDVLKLSVVGTTLTAYVNGSSVGSTTDSSISSGQFGIFMYGSGSPIIDNWEGGSAP
jgi:hypothetical protein